MMLSTMKQPTAPTTSNLSPHPSPLFVAHLPPQPIVPIRRPQPVAHLPPQPATPVCHPQQKIPPQGKKIPQILAHFRISLYICTRIRKGAPPSAHARPIPAPLPVDQ